MSEDSNNLEELEAAVEAMLARVQNLTPERIREWIGKYRFIHSVDDAAAEKLARRFEHRHGVTMTIGSMLMEKGYEPWLENARAQIDPYYWGRYKKLLGKKHFSTQVIATIDNVTDRILGLMENPEKAGPWNRRGMVVGHVQSGKTANYTGLICKAADAGYRLILVLAGFNNNNLRNQTQLRIDEGFVGRDSARLLSRRENSFVGVGRFDSDQKRRPFTLTNSLKDFNKAMATSVGVSLQALSVPAVLVIKKNSSTLKNLLEWLVEHNAGRGGKTIDAPMLLIDDEADNASINVKYGKAGVTRINGQIRSLLGMFERACYVGYTATPFANIFIDPDTDDEMFRADLFPRNFIVSLDPPTNYFGANRVFLQDNEQIIRHIEDNDDVLPLIHKIDWQVSILPNSLMEAVRVFVIAKAIRLVRGHFGQHCSMLVNTSRFTNVQRQLRNELHNKLETIKASVRVNGALAPEKALKDPEIKALHNIWKKEYSQMEGLGWAAIQQKLNDAAAPIKVVEVNSKSSGALNYSDYENAGLNVIAVGGYSLSRGLTLEGLMVSYFLRNSMMYDTLMQMGRWFGYRPEYDDLCRVWMPEEAEGWYVHVAEAIEELRDELRKMEAAGATPEEFGLKVRSHPTALIVTARNKMGSGEKVVVKIGLGNNFVETAILKRDVASLEANRLAAKRLSERLVEAGKPPYDSVPVSGGRLLTEAPVKPILDFLSEYHNHPGSLLTETGPVKRYIEERAETELAAWDILFAGIKESENSLTDTSLGIPINCQRRTAGKSDATTLRVTNKQRVSSRGIEKTGLTKEEIEMAEQGYQTPEVLASDKPINYPDRIYRAKRKRPLLIIHLLEIKPETKPVVAWSISFPKTGFEEKRVEYIVNTTWFRENFHNDSDEEEVENDD
ncbi:MAG: Z1 domain-containing protein [Verrucomicrobiota bacterium]|nr:Z1 domain-containing protein [Verrucomicrobiota bacterium]